MRGGEAGGTYEVRPSPYHLVMNLNYTTSKGERHTRHATKGKGSATRLVLQGLNLLATVCCTALLLCSGTSVTYTVLNILFSCFCHTQTTSPFLILSHFFLQPILPFPPSFLMVLEAAAWCFRPDALRRVSSLHLLV